VHHGKAAHREVVDARLSRIEHRATHVDLDVGLVGIDVLELRPDCRVRLADLREPQPDVRRPRLRAPEHEAERSDPACRLDLHVERSPRLPPARVRDLARAQEASIGCVPTDLDGPAARLGRGANLQLRDGALAEIDSLVADPVAVVDPTDALTALGAVRGLNTLLCRERRGRNSAGPHADRPQPCDVQKVLSVARRVARSLADGFERIVELGRLDEPVAVEVDRAAVVVASLALEPVAVDQVAIRIEVAEEAVGDCDLPRVVLHLLPALDDLGTFDHDLLTGRGLIHDAFGVRGSATGWRHALAIRPLMHRHDVARLRDLRRLRDRPKRLRRRPGVFVTARNGDMRLPRRNHRSDEHSTE